MKAAIAFALILFAVSAFGADVMSLTAGDNTLTLQDTPCNKATAKRLKPEHVAKFRNATDKTAGPTLNACWIITQNGTIFVVYEDGDGGEIPLSMFKRMGELKPGKGSV